MTSPRYASFQQNPKLSFGIGTKFDSWVLQNSEQEEKKYLVVIYLFFCVGPVIVIVVC